MAMNSAYFRSFSGIIKLCIVLAIFCAMVCACVNCWSYRIWFLLCALIGLVIELLFYLFYLLMLTDKINMNWAMIDFFVSIVFACISFINFVVACAKAGPNRPQDGASAFFWLLLLILFCVDCYFCFRAWRQGSSAPAAAATNVGPSYVPEQNAAPAAYPAYTADPAPAPTNEYAN